MTAKQTHRNLILQYLREHKEGLTAADAWELFVFSMLYPIRISELIRMGYSIEKTIEEGTNRYGVKTHWVRYRLREEKA